VYAQREPKQLIQFVGQAPLAATVYDVERLRCNLCGECTADTPAEVGDEEYDATSASMMALLKYGSGLPVNRLVALPRDLEIPLPPSAQWDIVQETATVLQPARDELIRQAARGAVLHNDDTSMRVLALRPAAAAPPDETPAKARTGTFTSGIVATPCGLRISESLGLPETPTLEAQRPAAVLSNRARMKMARLYTERPFRNVDLTLRSPIPCKRRRPNSHGIHSEGRQATAWAGLGLERAPGPSGYFFGAVSIRREPMIWVKIGPRAARAAGVLPVVPVTT